MSVGFATDVACLEHVPPAGHPDTAARLSNLLRQVRRRGVLDRVLSLAPREATDAEILRVHSDAHLNRVLEIAGLDASLDPDTYTSPGSVDAARRALGSTLGLVDAVLDGRVRSGFAAVRPPGHHATGTDAMGFCIFNNVAAAVAHALEADGVRRVLVVDWDVHFGNGTEEIFRGDDRVLVFSAHRYPFYPFTGGADRVYDGRSVNAPLPKGFGDASVGYAFVSLLAPVARSFGPDLVVVSAGYDAHRDDPLGGCAVSDDGFTLLSRFVAALAAELCEGRWLAVLEGGYDLGATARSALRTIEVMLEHDRAPVSFGQADALVRGIVSRAKSAIRRTDFGRTIDWGPSGHA